MTNATPSAIPAMTYPLLLRGASSSARRLRGGASDEAEDTGGASSPKSERSSARSSRAEANRSAGRLLIALRQIASSRESTRGFKSRGRVGSSVTCIIAVPNAVVPSNGTLPVMSSNRMTPIA